MHPRPDRPPVPVPRAARRAPDQRGFTVTHLLAAIVAVALLLVTVLVIAGTQRSSSHRRATPPTVTPGLQPVLRTLNQAVARTTHAIPYDTNGCGHAKGQRAVVSFLADGAAP